MIALRVDQHDAVFAIGDLATNDEARFERVAQLGMFFLLCQADIPKVVGGIADGFHSQQAHVGALFDIALDLGDGGLSGGEVAC